jgi:glycopeptide antibiotics resistance protein
MLIMPADLKSYISKKRWTLLAIILIVPLGLYSKIYDGPASNWVNNSLGGVLYVIFWSLLFSLLAARSKSWKIVGLVFLITCAIEFLQLWHPPFMETIRSTFIGATLFGNSFSWLDMAHYIIGALASLGLLKILR